MLKRRLYGLRLFTFVLTFSHNDENLLKFRKIDRWLEIDTLQQGPGLGSHARDTSYDQPFRKNSVHSRGDNNIPGPNNGFFTYIL
jgi:hypothetical protein